MNSVDLMNRAADNIRILSAAMVERAKSGHPGGAMGGADFINVLYSEFLLYDPDDPAWEERDRLFLDPGHMSPMLYAVLALSGKYGIDDLKKFRQWGSVTPGHPELDVLRGIENTSGPLGQGHVYAVGAAIASKFLKARLALNFNPTIYTFISDGGVQEEISQGAGRIAGHLGLDNLIMFYDANGIQLSHPITDTTSEKVAMKYKAWGWNVSEIDGCSAEEIRAALKKAKEGRGGRAGRPTLIIGRTVMGKGAVGKNGESFENSAVTHGCPLSVAGASFEETVKNLGGNPEAPFAIFPEVQELYNDRKSYLRSVAAKRRKIGAKIQKEYSKAYFKNNTPKIDWESIVQKADGPTRNASAEVLARLAEEVPNMIVSSADLCNSDKTEAFLNKSKIFKKGDFSGAFLQAGVAELTMACLSIGMALHGGVLPINATFFVFSDYMKPAIRMAALMELPVIFLYTHDSFRVGEDGPTHQPIEQEAQIRLLEKMKNHSGANSLLVLRPADAHETTVCWRLALENRKTPTVLIFSRQNVKDLPARTNRYAEAQNAYKGAYIVESDGLASSDKTNPDVILIASGSEVSTLVEAAALLRRDGLKVRVVSAPSEGLFRAQPKTYQDKVLPHGVKVFGLTAGLPVTLEGLAGANGKVFGLSTFGFSAPYKVLDEKFGFTAQNVYEQVKNW